MINGSIVWSTMKEMEKKTLNNDTTRFMLPLVGYKKDVVMNKDYIGSYIQSDILPEYDYHLMIIYSNEQTIFNQTTNYFKIDDNWIYIFHNKDIDSNISNFIEGKYSKFTLPAKKKILIFWNLNADSRLSAILFPKQYMFELGLNPNTIAKIRTELWSKPTLSLETFICT